MILLPTLSQSVQRAIEHPIAPERSSILQPLIEYVQRKIDDGQEANLNFICTHNSRRSQFSQIWAQTAADYFGIPVNCYSGGVEVTAFNERAVASLRRTGFEITSSDAMDNPRYSVISSEEIEPTIAFSKFFDDPINQAEEFAAVMTCSHADENCPFIPGTEQRIPVRYEDPKEFDNTLEEGVKYDERSAQIAAEMFHVFSSVQKSRR